MFENVLESPAFWILGGGGVAMELIGWMASKKMDMPSLPLWQMIVMMVGTLVAAAYFATRD